MALAGKTALVVGGTNGIGRGFAEWLAQNGASVIVGGRSRERGQEVVEAMKAVSSTPDASHAFMPVDATTVRDTDRFCRDFCASHKRLDLLVMSQGVASMGGREETEEGLDRKMAIHYYCRVALVQGLLPLLEQTASDNGDVRVLSILSGGVHSPYTAYREDPELKTNFSLVNCANATGFYNDLACDALAREHPQVTFVHAAPGFVATAWGSDFNPLLRGIVRFLQFFAKSPAACARDLSPTLVDPQWRGGFRIASATAQPGRPTRLQDEARDFIWEHTNQVLSRIRASFQQSQ